MRQTNLKVKIMCEGALLVAVALILSYFKIELTALLQLPFQLKTPEIASQISVDNAGRMI